MKKIISFAAAVLTFSVAFAEVSVEFTQAGYISTDKSGNSVKFDLNGYDTDKKVTGCYVTEVSNDVAGVVFDIDPWMKEQGRENVDGADKILDQYYGWVNFMGGNAKIQSGVWESRSLNRMKQDAGSWENPEYEKYKPGVISGSVGQDVTNLTEGNLATALSYTLDNMYVTAAIVDTGDYGSLSLRSGFALEAGFDVNESTNVKAYLKNYSDQAIAFAAFGESTGLYDGLDLVAGLTLGNLKTVDGFEFAVDVRARYELNDKIAFTTMNNFSSVPGTDGAVYTVWDMLSMAYSLSEKTKLTVTGEWSYEDLDASNNGTLSIIPGLTYSPCEGAEITTGLIFETSGWKEASDSNVSVPFVLHVAL